VGLKHHRTSLSPDGFALDFALDFSLVMKPQTLEVDERDAAVKISRIYAETLRRLMPSLTAGERDRAIQCLGIEQISWEAVSQIVDNGVDREAQSSPVARPL